MVRPHAQRETMGNVACIPEDVLDKASCWLERSDILSQRAVSRSARDAARRAIARKAIPDVRNIKFREPPNPLGGAMVVTEHSIVAMGNVFGAGCVELTAAGTSAPITALSSFVSSTNGGLRALQFYGTDILAYYFVKMCLASPNLVTLCLQNSQISDEAIAVIASACPKLEDVCFSDLGSTLSPAERWGRLFPRLRELDLRRWMGMGGPVYRPTRLDAIAAAARITSATELLVEGCHITRDVVEAVVGTAFADRITKFGCAEDRLDTIIETDAFFAAARGFPRLVHLTIPQGTTIADPDFYARLARIRTLESITIAEKPGWHMEHPDEHVVAACTHNRLEKLTLEILRGLTRNVVDGIISSPSAATLREIDIGLCEEIYDAVHPDIIIRDIDMLRLARNLPRLTKLSWQRTYFPARMGPRDFTTEREIYEVLVGRGGNFYHDVDHVYE